MTSEIRARTLDWGTGWASVPGGGGLQRELDRELAPQHPLSTTKPVIFGRCLACDDVVVRLTYPADGPELAVVHLTLSGRADKVTSYGVAWLYFKRYSLDSYDTRYVRVVEH